MKLPQVHIAVNVAGLATAVGSVAAFAVQNQTCVTGAAASISPQDGLLATAIIGALAAFLPTKKPTPPPTTSVGNVEQGH